MLRLSRRESRSWSKLGALLAFLATGLLAPSTARASCSHYVLWKHASLGAGNFPGSSASEAGGLGLELLTGAGAISAPVSDVPMPVRLPQRKPCTGAFCSGSPAVPEIPQAPSAPRADQWGLVADVIPPSPSPSLDLEPEDDRAHPSHRGSGIFHPPRLCVA